MRLTKRFRSVGLVIISLLLAGLTLSAQTQKWNSNDWDDDLVLDSVEDNYDVLTGESEKDPYIPGKLNPLAGPLAAGRALVLSTIQANGMSLPVATRFIPSSDFSIEFWYSPVSDSSNANGSLFSFIGSKNSYSIDVKNGVISATLNGSTIPTSTALTKYATMDAVKANPLDNNIWNYIALTWLCGDNNTYTASLYVNGARVASASGIPALDLDTTAIALIGKGCANGYIDEFSFWNKALSASEISADYNGGNGKVSYYAEGDKHGLVCYYRFDDGGESIEDYAYLPDFEAAAELDPEKTAELEALTDMFQYRVMASDNGVRTTALYKDAAKTELIQKGHPVWVTNLAVSMAEPEILRSKEADVDSDYDGFINDGDTDLDSKNIFALVRVKGDDALKNITLLQGGNFIVYDDLGQALWVVKTLDKTGKLDAPQLSYGNNEVSCAKFAANLSSAEYDFTDGLDDDGDGVIDDTCIAKGNLASPVKPAISDADDDGIVDNDESKGIDPLCKAKITNPYYSTSPLYNRVLDLTETGTRYASPDGYYTNNNMNSNGFTLELWYKLTEKPDGSATKYPLIYKTNVKPTLPADFWFGFEQDEKDENKLKLTLKYRTIANTTASEAIARYSLKEVDLLDPALGWVHVAATVTEDTTNADAMMVNFVVYADGSEYKSIASQLTGVIGAGSGILDSNTSNKNGKLVIGSTKSAESLKMFVDEVRIWRGVRSATELAANRNMFLDTIPSSLITYYRFDDGANVSGRNTIQDFVANLAGTTAAATDAALFGKAKVTTLPADKQGDETFEYLNADTDKDKMPDFWEIAAFQSLVRQKAGIDYAIRSDIHAALLAVAGTGNVDGYTDYDGDGLNDYYEFRTAHDPMVDDTNAVTFNEATGKEENDLNEYDADGDGLTLLQEQKNGTNPNEYNNIGEGGGIVADTDDDGISDDDEDTGNTGDESYGYTIYELTGKYDPLSPLVWRALIAGGTESDKLIVPENTTTIYGADVDANNVEAQNWTLETWFILDDDASNTGSLIRRVRKDGNGTYFDLGLDNGVPYVKATMKNEFPVKENGEDGKKELTKELVLQPKTGSAIPKNTWTHLVAEWDARHQTMSLYINGTITGSVYCFGAPLIDGSDYTQFTTEILADFDGQYLKGHIDEVRIWTYVSGTQNGIRRPHQIKEWMSKALPVLRSNTALNNAEHIPAAYYRFDDGGKYAQNFTVIMDQSDPRSYYSMTLQNAAGEDADLTERMVSVWDVNEDGSLKSYDEANVALRAINMSGGESAEFDPIPDGWKQIYWPNNNVGSKYDLNLDFINATSTVPAIYPGESSFFVDPLTGEVITPTNSRTDQGSTQEAYTYFTDIYFNDINYIDTVRLTGELGGYADGTSGTGINEIYIFVNGERIGYSGSSTGNAGEDMAMSLSTQVSGNNTKGNFAWHSTSTSPISFDHDIKSAMVKGRNRITIFANHVYSTGCSTAHNHNYYFYARIRVNGRTLDNELSHVKWFKNQQSPSLSHSSVTGMRIAQEDTDHCHAKQKDGVTDLLYFWFEKNYGIQPWAYDQDPDGDGLTNWMEYLANTNPLSKINGDDLMFDSERDRDGDKLNNQIEQYLETLPNVADTDDDGVNDYEENTSGYSPLDSTSAPNRKNLALVLNGRTVFSIPEVGDVSGQDDLSQWTIEAWIKPKFSDGRSGDEETDQKRQVILARTVGRYDGVDCTNYELGLTEEGLPYAGFTVVKDKYENGKLIGVESSHIYAEMTLKDGFTKLGDDAWTHVAASFTPMTVNDKTGAITSGKIELYVDGQLAYTLNNVSDIAPTTYRGVSGLTIGMPLPQDGEIAALADDETKTVANSFIGEIDNLAVWTKVRTADEIKETQSNGLVNIVKQSKTFLFYNWKVPVPYLRTDENLLHAFTFDDGGTSIENYAWKQDWYNGFAHAIPMPLDVTMSDAAKEDDERNASDLTDTDGDGMPDEWEEKYGLDPEDPSDAAGDLDGDGVSNLYEYLVGTDPTVARSENVVNSTGAEKPDDVNDADWDPDGDGLSNFYEQILGTNPMDADTDDDGIADGDEYSVIPDEDGNIRPMKDNTSPIHSMNRHADPADLNSDTFVNRALNLSKIGKGKSGGLTIPQPDNDNLDDMSAWTIETWFRYDCAAADVNGALFRRKIGNLIGFELGLKDAVPYVTYTTERGSKIEKTYTAALPSGQWIHLAATWNPETRKLMLVVDGSSAVTYEHSKSAVDYLPVNAAGLIMIADPQADESTGTAKDWKEGIYMDEVRIWNVARTVRQIGEQMDELIQTGTAGLVRYFRFDDGGKSIEDFAHPGWKNAANYALPANRYKVEVVNGTAEWVTDGTVDTPAIRGIDDADGDGMPDWFEFVYNLDDPVGDEDGDGLTNLYEYLAGTDPTDTTNGFDDYNAMAPAGDMSNGDKQFFGLDPRLTDSDGDGISDLDEIEGNLDGAFARADMESYSSNPLSPLSTNDRYLKHFVFSGSPIIIKNQSAHAMDSWTVMATVKASSKEPATIFKRQVSEQGVNFELGWGYNGELYAKFVSIKGEEIMAPAMLSSNLVIGDDWTNLAASYDADKLLLTLYVNGMPVAETKNTKKVACPGTGDGVFGGEYTGAKFTVGENFTGSMDSIRVYPTALSGDQIARDYTVAANANEGKAEPYGEGEANYTTYDPAYSMLRHDHAAGQLIVKFKNVLSAADIQMVSDMVGATMIRQLKLTGAYLVELPEKSDVRLAAAVEDYRWIASEELEYVVPNYIKPYTAVPNDQYFNLQWGLANTGQGSYYGGEGDWPVIQGKAGCDINVQPVWDAGFTGSRDVVVAIIDSGVEYTHPDLKNNILYRDGALVGYDFFNDDDDPSDDVGHGTHCAGIVGAVGNNSVGVTGVNWNVSIMPLKVGGPEGASSVAIIDAISYAIENGASIANCSYGNYSYDEAEYDAMRKALDYGLLFCCAAGNDALNIDAMPCYPACYDLANIISVAASDPNDELTSFSCYGAKNVDVAAPGYGILSTYPGSALSGMSGTSMACPMVVGVAALLKSAIPSATAMDLKEAIIQGCDYVDALKGKVVSNGRVNVYNSYEILSSRDAVLCLRANAVFDGKAYDLTKIELGATAKGVNGKAPELGRYLADASAVAVEATAFEDFKYFAGDADGDGIADWLEVALGLDPNAPDGALDYDADGLTNYFEAMTNMITADAAYAGVALSPWNAQTNGADLDYDLTNAALGDKKYSFLQNNGFHPLTGIGDYADWNRDDDKFVDTDEKETNAGNPLLPYVAHVLKLTDGAFVELPNQPRFATDDAWSVDAWLKISQEDYDNRTTGSTRVIMSREIDADLDGVFELVNYELGIEAKTNGWFAYARYTTAAKAVVKVVSTTKLPADEWTHIGAAYSAEARKLMIAVNNGAPNPKSTATAVPAAKIAGISRVRLGSEEAGKGFIGELDAVRFWNIAKADFSDYMQADMLTMSSTPLLSMGLVAYYIFDDGGETAQDFAVALDDWNLGWNNAGLLNGAEMIEDVSPVTPSEKDSDGDGIPDWWEKKYGLNPEDPADATEDLDGDALPNLYEFLTGNDPFQEDTDGNGITDDWEDYDGDGLTNGEEVVFSTRPDKVDTDDDGFTDACETGYDWYDAEGNLVAGVGYDFGVSATASLSQPNATFTSFALNSDIAKVFRMNGENRMTVANNRYTTGNKMTISFWFRPTKIQSGMVTFLRRTVTDEKGYSNYAFSFDGQNLYLNLYAKGASVPTQVAYKPASGFKEGSWYLIAAIIDAGDNPVYEDETEEVEGEEGAEGDAAAAAEGEEEEEPVAPSTKSVTLIGFSGTLNTSTNEYIYTAKSSSKNLSFANGLNVGENGNLILGVVDAEMDKWTDAVLDVDNLYIWNVAKTVADIKTLVENTTIGTGDITTGLVAQYLFDDGGETAEDFCRAEDWWNNWQYAGVLNIPTEQPDEQNFGCGMILDASLADFSNDKDKDGLPDDWEIFYFGNLEQGATDDPDEDGLSNLQEYNISGNMRDASETDLSYSNQYAWLNPTSEDSDGDGLPDAWEVQYPAILNPLDPDDANLDSDSDGLTNWKEYLYGTDPTNADTDEDGLPDGWEVQYMSSDKDVEGNPVAPSLNPLSADDDYGADGDPDGDGYTNADEYLFGTNPIVADSPDADTDGDGVKDVIERKPGVNTDSTLTDTDDDEEDDYTEISLGTKGYDSTSKSALASYTNNFMYEGNKVAQFNVKHGTLTVPAANDPDRIGFGSWTVEARFRHTDVVPGAEYTVYLVRRSYSNSSYQDNEKVDDADAAWNYAIGYTVKDGEVYPFTSFKAHAGAQIRKVETDTALPIINGKTDWHFVSGVYDSIAKQMQLYVDGELVAAKTFKSITTATEQSPSSAKIAGGYDFTTTKIGEIFAEDNDTSAVMIDEVRVWGIKPNTVEAEGTNTGYIANFVRSAAEITDGHFRPVTPVEGIYDGGLADQYATTDASGEPIGDNTVDYAVDNHVSDGEWTTKTGAVGIRAIVSYHDENDNGIWDPGEDIWRDQTLADAIAIAQAAMGEAYDATVFEKLTEADVTTAHYEENVDVKLAQGKNGWKPGTAYSRTVVNENGSTSSVSVTAEQSAVGQEIAVYYIDKNNNGQIDAEDDFWVDYDYARDVETWYAAAENGWAKRMGLALYYRFDDGGGSIEDYAWRADWRSSPVWAHAIRPTELAGFFPPKNVTDKGGKDNAYQYVTEALDDGFAWVIDAYLAPEAPEAEIYTLSNGNAEPATVAYIPQTEGDLYDYDVLSGHISKDAVDPEGGNITYLYYWLLGDGWDGKLAYEDGDLVDKTAEEGVISGLITTGKELDLYIYDSIAAGDTVTLAVVAKSESGKASPVVTSTIAIAAKDNALPEAVVFSHWNAKPATAGKAITVTLKVQDRNAGYVVIKWYRNLNLFSTETQAVSKGSVGRTVSFTVKSDFVVDGDVWGYKAYFQKTADSSLSRTTPPESEDGNEWIFCPVGVGYDEYDAATSNSAPTIPRNVVITPEDVDENSMLIATASGSSDPDGDKFAYMYQWYQNGELVAGETMPYFPYLTDSITITELDGETQTTLNATTLSEGDIIVVRVWAVDVYGNASNKLISDPVIIGPDLAEINEDISEAGTIYAYEPNNTSKKATRLLPKEDWSDAGDGNVQEHYFCDKDDVDWFWFIVPQTLTSNKSIVKLETNNGEQMFYPTHFLETGNEIDDTYIELYNNNLKRIASNDDTRLADGRGTIYARLEVELEPGLYYARVSRSGKGYYGTMWTMHLGITSERGSQGPAFDELTASVVLTPEMPSVASDLICTASGAVSSSGKECEYYYVWYRNGELVPFGTVPSISAWSTARYVIAQAKNFGSGQPNVVEAEYTKPGDIWWCDVYAKDEYGYSEPIQSNWVTVEGESWSVELQVYKTFRRAGLTTVAGSDQSVIIGMDDNATFGFDPSLDIAAATTRYLPGTDEIDRSPLPLGAAYSIGMDNTCTRLSQDIRPFGRSSVWYIRVDMGDPKSSINGFTLSWADATLPTTSVGGLKLTRMIQLTDKTWEPISDTTVDMTETTSVSLDESELDTLQQDEYGQYYAVYRVALGAADEAQTITLKPGWNMISFAVTPLVNTVDDVFTVNSTKLIRGNAWRYEGGQYVAAATIDAGVGYWIYANINKSTTLTIYGNRPTDGVELKAGWNLVGPLYNVSLLSAAYKDIYNTSGTGAIGYIYKAVSSSSGNIEYRDIQYEGYSMSIGNAYWIYCKKDVLMPFAPANE